MYKIGELSKLSKIPVKTLRYYDREGILRPDYIDPSTNYRYYNTIRLSDCYRIVALKELGFRLSEIREIFSKPQEEFAEIIGAKQKELCELKQQTEYRLSILANLDSMLKEDVSMFNIVIRKCDEMHLAYCRRILAQPSECSQVLEEIYREVPEEILGKRAVVIDYETEFVSENLDTGFGVEITGKLPKTCVLSEKFLNIAGDTASLICAEEEYMDAVRILNKYILDNDYQIVGPTYKFIYPDNTVEIKIPVVKLGDFSTVYNEEINLPFTCDEEAIGRWEMVDSLPCREMFLPGKPKSAMANEFVKELYFLADGERYWCFGWTKGLLLSDCGYPHRRSKNKYTIEKIENETYMFIEFKGEDYFRGGRSELWVLRKADSRKYRKADIQIREVIPDLPAKDLEVLGEWQVCALVRDIEAFDPHKDCSLIPYEGLYWRSAKFIEGGEISNSFKEEKEEEVRADQPGIWRWVTGYVICTPRSTASHYIIRKYDGVDYLFIQWKSGDYSFGKSEPSWYVFKRK